ncbi:hypothetical protein ZIOFF_048737 [Zingiber officinale]|uniref:Phenylalanine--tRNA ligase beta subunit B1 domain-containing protein n=1 Tax=Zingiber officinale TaxID=94328 RepID=A0A8J5FR58_ZINOF|nr:hypothetical protein ZIOFF_048737 [Zingiber officinale]
MKSRLQEQAKGGTELDAMIDLIISGGSVWFQEEQEVGDEDEEVIFKIGVAANRYNLLCLEGIAWALRIFIEKEASPLYTVTNVSLESILKMHVKPETSLIRPFVVCAVLRGIAFDEARYNSFIDLQDKLHQNICSVKIYSSWNTKRRTLVAIGTHDLDTIQGPFSYEAVPPQEINFVPLKQSDMKLKKFLHIIENSPVYPVIYDRNRWPVCRGKGINLEEKEGAGQRWPGQHQGQHGRPLESSSMMGERERDGAYGRHNRRRRGRQRLLLAVDGGVAHVKEMRKRGANGVRQQSCVRARDG